MKKSKIDYTQKVLEVEGLKQHFKSGIGKRKLSVKAVSGISFDIYKREVFGLVGESGCGKTTTGRTIMRLYKPTSGIIKLNGWTIGWGAGLYYGNIRRKKQAYKIEKLQFDQVKNDRAKLANLLDERLKNLHLDVKKAHQEYLDHKQEILKPNTTYKAQTYEEKIAYGTKLQQANIDYELGKKAILLHTKNEFVEELKFVLKNLKTNFKNKVKGLKDSAGLSKETQEKHILDVRQDYEKALAAVKAQYEVKIQEKSQKILDKATAKEQIQGLKNTLISKTKTIKLEHHETVSHLQRPPILKNYVQVAKLYFKYLGFKFKVGFQSFGLRIKLLFDLLKVKRTTKPDYESLRNLKIEHQKYIQEQKELISKSKRHHFSKASEERTRDVQMIFQDPISSLNPRMTVLEIVSEGLVINGEKDKKVIKEKVIKALEMVGLAPEYISRYPHEFSGGQRQRIGIARALVMNPSLIIADEPISALDVSIKAQVINLLTDIKNQLGLTIMFIAHDLSVVKFFCDRIAVMYYGKIVEMASSQELFKNPLHPYTKSLLSAIPHPDPSSEKTRKRIFYNPMMHDYRVDGPEFTEIKPGHFVLANQSELVGMRKEILAHEAV